MEDILSSIKRIIAEEGEAPPARPRRGQRAATATPRPDLVPVAPEHERDEVLELNDPMPMPSPAAASADPSAADPAAAEPVSPPGPIVRPSPASLGDAAPPDPASPIVSQQTAAATRGSLDSLSRLLVKPEPASDGTLEGLVRDMLRPMLRDWLDANLPPMVEAMVAREIAKITGQAG